MARGKAPASSVVVPPELSFASTDDTSPQILS